MVTQIFGLSVAIYRAVAPRIGYGPGRTRDIKGLADNPGGGETVASKLAHRKSVQVARNEIAVPIDAARASLSKTYHVRIEFAHMEMSHRKMSHATELS